MNIYNTVDINSKLDSILGKSGFKKDFKSHLLYIIFHIRTYPFKDRSYSTEDYIPVKLEYLRKLVSFDYASKFLKLLVDEGLLETDNRYEIGVKSKGYRLSQKYRKGKFFLEEVQDKDLVNRIKKGLMGMKNEVLRRNDSYSYITQWMEHLNIDMDKALNYVETEVDTEQKKDKFTMMLEIFDEKFSKVDKTSNRLHNNLTNLATPLRSYLTLNGHKIAQCDLKNSQPLLFRIHLETYTFIPVAELDKYLDVVCNIGFYEFFAEKLNIKLDEKNRTDFKKKIFGGVLFDRNRRGLSKYEKVFKEEFPIIFHCMRDMKADNYKNIPIALQKLESEYIFKCVDRLRKDYENIELLTIHDSIATVEGKEQIVYDVMMEEFYNSFGILPKIKIEKFA